MCYIEDEEISSVECYVAGALSTTMKEQRGVSLLLWERKEICVRNILIFSAAALLAGCSATYKQDVVYKPVSKLERGKPVVVATPTNGSYGNREYQSSGRHTAQVVQSAFSRFSSTVVVLPNCRDIQCLLQDGKQKYSYYVVPEILHWEDRNTEWSGLPDRVEVRLVVYDNVQKELASVVVSGKSKWATLGGDHPEDLLPEPFRQYVESLY